MCGHLASNDPRHFLRVQLDRGNAVILKRYRRFDVVGGVSGRTYRIRLAGAMNVEEIDQRGRCLGRLLCFFPEGQLVVMNVMEILVIIVN